MLQGPVTGHFCDRGWDISWPQVCMAEPWWFLRNETHCVPSVLSSLSPLCSRRKSYIQTLCKNLHSLRSFWGRSKRTSLQLSVLQALHECDPNLRDSIIISVQEDLIKTLPRTSVHISMPKADHMKSYLWTWLTWMGWLKLRELGDRSLSSTSRHCHLSRVALSTKISGPWKHSLLRPDPRTQLPSRKGSIRENDCLPCRCSPLHFLSSFDSVLLTSPPEQEQESTETLAWVHTHTHGLS